MTTCITDEMCRLCLTALLRFHDNVTCVLNWTFCRSPQWNTLCLLYLSSHLPTNKAKHRNCRSKNNKDFMWPSFKRVCKTVNGLHSNSANCKLQWIMNEHKASSIGCFSLRGMSSRLQAYKIILLFLQFKWGIWLLLINNLQLRIMAGTKK